MKKKIALFMACAMTFATMPLSNMFAASTNTLSRTHTGVDDKSYTTTDPIYFNMELKDEMASKTDGYMVFSLNLTNAEWVSEDDYNAYISAASATEDGIVFTSGSASTSTGTSDPNLGLSDFEFIRRSSTRLDVRLINTTEVIEEDSVISVPIYAEFDDNEAVTLQVVPGITPITAGTYALTRTVEGPITVTSDGDKDIVFEESIPGSLKVNEEQVKVTIVGSNAEWIDGGEVVVESNSTYGLDNDRTISLGSDNINNRILTFDVVDLETNNTGLSDELEFSLENALRITNRNFEGEIKVYVEGLGADRQLVTIYTTEEDVDVYRDSDDPTEIISGKDGEELEPLVIEELTETAFRNDRYVKVIFNHPNVWFEDETKVEVGDTTLVLDRDYSLEYEKIDGEYYHVMYIEYDEFDSTTGSDKEKITITPFVSVPANISGKLEATVSGTALLFDNRTSDTVHLADLNKTFDVKAEIAYIKPGITNNRTGRIVITENEAGALEEGTYYLTLSGEYYGRHIASRDNSFGNLYFTKSGSVTSDSSEVDAYMDGIVDGEAYYLQYENSELNKEEFAANSGTLKFEIANSSYDSPATYVIEGAEVSASLLLLASNENITLTLTNDQNLDRGYEFDYLAVGDENFVLDSDTEARYLNQNVVYTIGDSVVSVDGDIQVGIGAPYLNANESTMIPVRSLALSLGLPEENVVWNPVDRTATIFTSPSSHTSFSKFVKFELGSTQLQLSDSTIPVDMVSASGGLDTVEVVDDRAYLPLKYVAHALGVDYVWHDATKSVTFNPR